MILTPVQLKLAPLSHFLAPRDQLLSKLPPNSFPVIIFFLGFFTHGKTIPWDPPTLSALPIPEMSNFGSPPAKPEDYLWDLSQASLAI